MRNLTEDDFGRVDSVMAAFQAAMLKAMPDAQERFMRNLSFTEKLKIGAAKLSYEFSRNADLKTRGQKLAYYCESALPALVRTFGEAALLRSMPQDAKNPEVVQLCEALGARKLAALVQKTI
jgi:hypothetical protein